MIILDYLANRILNTDKQKHQDTQQQKKKWEFYTSPPKQLTALWYLTLLVLIWWLWTCFSALLEGFLSHIAASEMITPILSTNQKLPHQFFWLG